METVYSTASKLLEKKLHQIYWLTSIIPSESSRTSTVGHSHFPNSPLLQWWPTETLLLGKRANL